jgi:hypothetical protein
VPNRNGAVTSAASKWSQLERQNFRPAAITNRDIATSALLIASMLALTAAVDAL